MSTRSGKKIHTTFQENPSKLDIKHAVQSEKKTRSKLLKEHQEDFCTIAVKTKKRANYVAYPTDDEMGTTDIANNKEDEPKPTRLLRKNALKEQNEITSETHSVNISAVAFKPVRTTRSIRKCSKSCYDIQENRNYAENAVNLKIQKPKKEKKKIKSTAEQEVEEINISKKNTKKKQKKRKISGHMVVENIIIPEDNEKVCLNKSNASVESFHSAYCSPVDDVNESEPLDVVSSPKTELQLSDNPDETLINLPKVRQTRSNTTLSRNTVSQDPVKVTRKRMSSIKNNKSITINETYGRGGEIEEFDTKLANASKKCKSSIKKTIVAVKIADTTIDVEANDATINLKDLEKREQVNEAAIQNTSFDKLEAENSDATFNKSDTESITETQSTHSQLNTICEIAANTSHIPVIVDTIAESPTINITIDKEDSNDIITQKCETINTTYEKDSDTEKLNSNKKQSWAINETYDKDNISSDASAIDHSVTSLRKSITQKQSTDINTTFDKNEKSDATFDNDKKLDTTYDKDSKCSLISNDYSNISSDKFDISRISITSDDSKENITNITPVVIESSIEESKMNTSEMSLNLPAGRTQNTPEICPKTPTPVTPLIREGTFTKDDTQLETSQSKLPGTPTRKMSLPSPGRTPFLVSKSSSTLMSVTHSLEKSRRSSLAELLPRTTRVMFCSPVNNPLMVMQQRKKVIKSNLKGSNKSFVFEESACEERAATRRKRSYTHNDVEDVRAKRKRLDSAAKPAGSVVRTRTASAGGSASEPGPSFSKAAVTPTRPRISRTKLPNFAALHQKEFSKMESLNECQERKMRRARHLLTPTGAVHVLSHCSPTDNSIETKKSPTLPQEEVKSDKYKKDPKSSKKDKHLSEPKKEKGKQESSKKEAKQPDTPIKSLPTLKSINPGYTRFGFKLNCDVNPFSIPTNPNASLTLSNKKNTDKKDNTKPLKEIKALKRQTALPSLIGATSRKEVAKQTIMREKSFTDKRNIARNENRTVIKGVRTNRRFELQMRMRNMDQ